MRPRVPTSTYRLQLRPATSDADGRRFDLDDAARLVPHLAGLGVGAIYLSPVFTATTGSPHGYDVTDPTTVSADLGGIAAFRRLATAARGHDLGIVLDIVPNHLGITAARENRWWWDVLRFGRESPHASHFDIDWDADPGAPGRIVVPVLGSADAVDELELRGEDGEPVLRYHEHRFPVRPGTDHGSPREIHDRQAYRLAHWRDGIVGYRRFFGVDGLAGIRQEDPAVFTDSHRGLRALLDEDLVDGVRVDHIDGLADPAGYLDRLRALIGPDRWLVVEKILTGTEPLDPLLAADGTTGYEALREFDGVFLDPAGESALADLAVRACGNRGDATAVRREGLRRKREAAQRDLPAEFRRLARAIRRDAPAAASAGIGDDHLHEVLVELAARMPVYRADYRVLEGTTPAVLADVARHSPGSDRPLALVSAALACGGEASTRFSQVCGAVMAKGIEDRTFYLQTRLVSLQEVGGDPGRFGVTPAEFHLAQAERARLRPRMMTTLSTHDTKRGEDVRARIGVLSQIPDLWARTLSAWSAAAPPLEPDAAAFLGQNLIGVFPTTAEPGVVADVHARFRGYAVKAMREAGTHTAWVDGDPAFEARLLAWVDAAFTGAPAASIRDFVRVIDPHARAASLGAKLLQLCGPGIPDVYQGTEVREDSLVDPDNRRFVDHDRTGDLLADLDRPGRPAPAPGDDAAKLLVVSRTLRLRRERPEVFVGAGYDPVFASGDAADHVIAAGRGRRGGETTVIAVATRRTVALDARGGWGDTTLALPPGVWEDRLTGRGHANTAPVATVLESLPVALLVHRAP